MLLTYLILYSFNMPRGQNKLSGLFSSKLRQGSSKERVELSIESRRDLQESGTLYIVDRPDHRSKQYQEILTNLKQGAYNAYDQHRLLDLLVDENSGKNLVGYSHLIENAQEVVIADWLEEIPQQKAKDFYKAFPNYCVREYIAKSYFPKTKRALENKFGRYAKHSFMRMQDIA